MKYFILIRMAIFKMRTIANVDMDVEKLGASYIADGNVKWCSLLGKQFGNSSKS